MIRFTWLKTGSNVRLLLLR